MSQRNQHLTHAMLRMPATTTPKQFQTTWCFGKVWQHAGGAEDLQSATVFPESCHSATLHLQKYCFLAKLRNFSQKRSLQQSHFRGRKHIGFLDSKKWSSSVQVLLQLVLQGWQYSEPCQLQIGLGQCISVCCSFWMMTRCNDHRVYYKSWNADGGRFCLESGPVFCLVGFAFAFLKARRKSGPGICVLLLFFMICCESKPLRLADLIRLTAYPNVSTEPERDRPQQRKKFPAWIRSALQERFVK